MTITASTYPTLSSFLESMRSLMYRVIHDLHLGDMSVTCSMDDCTQEGQIVLMHLFDKLQREGVLGTADIYLTIKGHLWRYCKKTFFVKVPTQMKLEELKEIRSICFEGNEGSQVDNTSMDDSLAEVELMQALLSLLNDREKKVLLLRLNGYSVAEAAQEIGVTRQHVHRIMKEIRSKSKEVISCDY